MIFLFRKQKCFKKFILVFPLFLIFNVLKNFFGSKLDEVFKFHYKIYKLYILYKIYIIQFVSLIK